ncbi:Kelch motif family protein [Histomonas meleagridis]|uniref:Kelch motif family protein n=1 Tax=Histomonas meleagridis TaxID=135588 RepID=UPI00355A4A4D|nr:Kelch motif family protein [Histomonas meleagridis]KAH0802602.1 Kelch motif family protein [Histomonas meleagridis]
MSKQSITKKKISSEDSDQDSSESDSETTSSSSNTQQSSSYSSSGSNLDSSSSGEASSSYDSQAMVPSSSDNNSSTKKSEGSVSSDNNSGSSSGENTKSTEIEKPSTKEHSDSIDNKQNLENSNPDNADKEEKPKLLSDINSPIIISSSLEFTEISEPSKNDSVSQEESIHQLAPSEESPSQSLESSLKTPNITLRSKHVVRKATKSATRAPISFSSSDLGSINHKRPLYKSNARLQRKLSSAQMKMLGELSPSRFESASDSISESESSTSRNSFAIGGKIPEIPPHIMELIKSTDQFQFEPKPSKATVKEEQPLIPKEENDEFPKSTENLVGFISGNDVGLFLFNTETKISSYYSYELNEKFVRLDLEQVPGKRTDFSLFQVSKSKFGLLGGDGADHGTDLWVFDCKKTKWFHSRTLGSTYPMLTNHCSAALKRNGKTYIYTFGGLCCSKFSSKLLLIIYCNGICTYRDFIPTGDKPISRIHHTMTICDKKIYLFGGLSENKAVLNDLWELDLSSHDITNPSWHFITTDGPPHRHSHQSFYRDGYFYIAGGFDEKGNKLNDIWRYKDSKWSLCGSYDITKQVFSSNLGLVSFSSKFELIKEDDPIMSLSEKFNKLIKLRDDYEQKYFDNIELLRIEYQNFEKVSSLLHMFQENQSDELFDEAKELLTSPKTIEEITRSVFDASKQAFNQCKESLHQSHNIDSNYYTNEIISYLESKYISLSNQYKSHQFENKTEINLTKSELSILNEMFGEVQQNSEEIDPTVLPDKSTIKNKSNYYQCFYNYQQRVYENNNQIIRKLMHKYRNVNVKYMKNKNEIIDTLKQISNIKNEFKSIQSEVSNINQKAVDVEKELKRMDLNTLQKENEEIKKKMKDDLESIADRQPEIQELFKYIQELKGIYRNKPNDAQNYIDKIADTILDLTAKITGKSNDDVDEESTSMMSNI